ncbi:MAG: helix-turn-helix domain-containing protein, partial [Alphaproteobacteria bacterium]
RFEEVMGRYGDGRLSCEEAADVLGMSLSTFYRWRRRYEARGTEGLADGRIGKASGRRVPTDEVARMLALYETRYFDFTAKHFHEKAVAEHDLKRSYTWTKNRLQEAGQIGKTKRRGAHRRKRPRKPLIGMMLHQDGSRHEWVPGQWWDLIVTSCRRHAFGVTDDADSMIYSGFFVAEEGTMSSFQGVRDVIEQKGLFGSLYADRGTHYWITTEAGGKVDKTNPTQVHGGASSLASN